MIGRGENKNKKKATTLEDVPDASVIDLFCGAGGLSHGFRQEGFEVVAGIDIDETCRYAFETNNQAPFIRRDVARLKAEDVNALYLPKKARVMVGCAPCQPFSTYNQKNDDPKWQLLSRFGGLIERSQPDIVSMENVPRLMSFRNGDVFNRFVKRLEDAGYYVVYDVLYGPDFGLAQTRSRLVLLASRLGEISMPEPTHGPANYRTVRDEIGDLTPISHGEVDCADGLHRASRLSEINTKRIKSAKPGGTWRDWKPELVAGCHRVDTGKGYSSVYGRMVWEEPSPTITTQFFGFGNGRFGHPEQNRALSLREGALLQGFPRDYEFVPPGKPVQMKNVGRLIGNAVPVKLASAIARAVKKHLKAVG